MLNQYLMWGGFVLFIIAMLILDLKVLQRRSHVMPVKEALLWVAFWVSLALIFNVGIYFYFGMDSALEFLTGYLVEYSLSVDNIFVFALIFSYFGIPSEYRHKALLWGILGAIVMRAIFILAGVAMINRLHWIIYVFGAFLVYIGIKIAFEKDREMDPGKNPILRLVKRFLPVTESYEGGRFFVRRAGRLFATPMLIVVIVIETTDVIFAVDSIPAILSITLNPFIVYTSNIFAILGLRALYFALAGIMDLFHYLNYGLAAILVFVGVKMLISDYYKIPVAGALGFIVLVLTTSIVASIMFPKKDAPSPHAVPDKR
ncbi:MAG: TerC family protein [Spirochaetota bacterium]